MRRSAAVGSVGREGGAVRRGCAYADLFVAGFELGYRDGEGVASATVGRFGEDRDGGRTEHRDRRFSGRARGCGGSRQSSSPFGCMTASGSLRPLIMLRPVQPAHDAHHALPILGNSHTDAMADHGVTRCAFTVCRRPRAGPPGGAAGSPHAM